MDEVYKYQDSIRDSLRLENENHQALDEAHNLDLIISKAKDYHEKLVNIKRSMLIMKDKTAKLKRRATKMLEDKNREDQEKQRSRERRQMFEKHLEPVVNTRGE